jgi:hypothetical protein
MRNDLKFFLMFLGLVGLTVFQTRAIWSKQIPIPVGQRIMLIATTLVTIALLIAGALAFLLICSEGCRELWDGPWKSIPILGGDAFLLNSILVGFVEYRLSRRR